MVLSTATKNWKAIFHFYLDELDDTLLTVEHEIEALLEAGFSQVNEIERWEVTHTLKAVK